MAFSTPDSLTTILKQRAEQACASRLAFLRDGEEEAEASSFGALDRRARAIAARLQAAAGFGERALLLYPPGLEFIRAFFGCLYSGVVAVPAYPPRVGRPQPRLRSILGSARPRFVLTHRALAESREALAREVPGIETLEWLATEELAEGDAELWREHRPAPEDLAFLQFTSGSTAEPKGAMVTHGNLLHNEEMIRRAFAMSERSVVVGWLPLYHDMGLIGNVLQPLYVGASCVLMSPLAFLQRPRRWLEAISRYRGTTSGGPNFAYELTLAKVPPAEREGLDLSSWTLAFNGAEPVRAATLERFAQGFAPCGFEAKAFYPCYGLAEATLFVTGGTAGRAPATLAVDASSLERDHAVPAEPSAAARELVSCGTGSGGQEVRVVDPQTLAPCPQGRVGEIWVSGGSVVAGYWGHAQASEESFGARLEGAERRYLRTGDLGFFDAAGELYVTGRLKDLLILRGRNHYPHDLELTAERACPGLRAGGGAAFSVELDEEERLVVVQEVEARAQAQLDGEATVAAIRGALSEEHDVQALDVVLVRAGTVPKTSSGKVQRRLCRSLYLEGRLERLGPPAEPTTRQAAPAAPSTAELLAAGKAERARLLLPWLAARLAEITRLPLPQIDPATPLTAFGLDSLVAVELRGRLEAELAVELPLGWLLEAPSLGEVASFVAERLGDGPLAEAPAPVASRSEEHPLSWTQQALWFFDRLAPGSPLYHIAAAARIRSRLDFEALRAALARLVERHPALATTFREAAGNPLQRVARELPLDLERVSIDGWEEERVAAARLEAAYAPFDLGSGPPLRVRVFERQGRPAELVLAVHHIVADLWSLAVVARELGALLAEPPEALPALPARGFVDGVRAGLDELERSGEAALDYFARRLEGAPSALDLPTDRPRPSQPAFRGDRVRARLDGPTTARLEKLARDARGSLFVALLAGFEVVLHRWSGQPDLVLGMALSGRPAAESAGLVGYFVNTLPLRARLSLRTPLAEALEAAREEAVGALERQTVPLPWLASRLEPQRDPHRSPLFQALVVYQKLPRAVDPGLAAFAVGAQGTRVRLGGLELETLELPERSSQLDLSLFAAEVDGALCLALQFDADLWDRATAQRLLGHLAEALADLAARPEATVGELRLLSAAERQQLAWEWNDTEVATPAGAALSLHGGFERQAEEVPERVALVAGEEHWSYRELDQWAGRLAGALRRRGVGSEERVGVLLERGPLRLVALLGVLKAGGCYVPLSPDLPAERLAYQVDDAGARWVLASAELEARLAGRGAAALDPLRLLAEARDPRAHEPVPADSAAYLIYTSGSTGRPKGVVNSHRGIANRLDWIARRMPLEAADRVLQKTPFGFDVSVPEMFWPLASGARLVLAPPRAQGDPLALAELLAGHGITTVHFVASMLQAFLEATEGRSFPLLRRLFSSGEAVPRALFARAAERLPGVELWDLYGPTEAAVEVSAHRFEPGPGPAGVPIGRPIDNLSLAVVDRAGRLVPAGVPGELWIGGVGVARGYQGRPAATAEAFVPDPFAPSPGGRAYRSGDRVRRNAQGELVFLERLDQQVKIRGVRIELAEIEETLRRLPEVADAAVAAVPGRRGELELVALVVAAESAALDEGSLRSRLLVSLPEAMVPWRFRSLPGLPRTASGKLDRRALLALAGPDEAGARGGAPLDAIEARLAAIWCELLEVPEVGREDSFFRLGGHSLLLTRLSSRLRESFGVELPLRRLFALPTLADLAAELRGLASAPELAAAPEASGPQPLSFAQERLWFLDRLEPGRATYLLPAAYRLQGELRPAALAAALEGAATRHELLRARFPSEGGVPRVEILPPSPWPLPLVDLSGLEDPALAAGTLAELEGGKPIDLGREAPLRARLLRLGGAEHWLLLTQHHIATDGGSLPILARELEAGYRAALAGEPQPGPAEGWQYGDFARWQRRHLEGERLEAEVSYWRSALSGAPDELALPWDRPRPAEPSSAGAEVCRQLPRGTAARLESWARGSGLTPFMALLAAYATLLARLSGQWDLVVGTPVAGRTRREFEGLIGLFVNTLALRFQVPRRGSFRELGDAVRRQLLAGLDHQELPFEKLVEAVKPGRSLGRSPLFQTLFSLGEAPPTPAFAGLEVAWLPQPATTAKVDLDVELRRGPEGELAAVAAYSTELLDAATVERWLGHFEVLLGAALAAPEAALERLPWLSPAERGQLLALSAGPLGAMPEGSCFSWIARRAASQPESVAVVAGLEHLSYAALLAGAGELASRLSQAGVRPGDRVAVCLGRCLALPQALLACFATRVAYVPLDPEYPAERLAAIVADAGAEVVVATPATRGLAKGWGGRLIEVGEEGERRGAAALDSPATEGEDLAYLVYTSGSTGRPKGVMVPQRGLANRLGWDLETGVWEPGDRLAQLTSASFDVSLWELLAPLAAGIRLELGPAEITRDPRTLATWLGERRITAFSGVPTLLAALVEEEPFAAAPLRALFIGGEAMPPELPGRVWSLSPARIFNMYGPTETSIDATLRECVVSERNVPIGRPLARLCALVVDGEFEPQPLGVPGELAVGGPSLALGYFRQPAATAERFVPDPTSAAPGERLYRTGDRARWLASGELEFLGRLDQQIKLRGVRIELAEIEARLGQHPAVAQAAVSLSRRAASPRLFACWVPRAGGAPPASEELRRFLARSLPEAMVPSAFLALEALPLLPNGKVDRRALPEPEEPGAAARDLGGPLRSPLEEVLGGIWCEVLGVPRVGPRSHFFELGGHSLLATRVAARSAELFGVELPLKTLFSAPTLGELAGEIQRALGPGQGALEPIRRLPREGRLPLSAAQERLWFLAQLEPASPAYNLPAGLRLAGPLEVPALAAALSGVVARHESLRSSFAEEGEEPVVRIAPAGRWPLPVVDTSALEAPGVEAERLARAEARRPFDLGRGPLFRGFLAREGRERHLLVLNQHHIVSDGWSLELLTRELGAAYRAGLEGTAAELPALAAEYVDYAAWQRQRLASGEFGARLEACLARLVGAPTTLLLPTDRPRLPLQSQAGALWQARLPAELAAALRTRSRSAGTTLFTTLLAGFAALLHRLSGERELLLGTPVANRQRLELEGLVGLFVNTLVVRADLGGNPSATELLARLKASCLAAYADPEVPFERLVAELSRERNLGQNPLVQVLFGLVGPPLAGLELPGLEVRFLDLPTGTAKVDLTLTVIEEGAELRLVAEYATELFDGATVGRWLAGYRELLRGLASEPGARLSELPLLTAAERHQLLVEWNDTALAPGREPTVHGAVAAQAACGPDRTALVFGEEHQSYAWLERRAEGLARRLAAAGVRRGTLVGLSLERSSELVPAVLGVLKAGGAYVPIDPAYPRERRALMLASSRVPVLLTESALLADLPPYGGERVLLDASEDAARAADGPLDPALDAEELAYVLFTSGSTGQPKGVQVRHGGVVNFLASMAERPGFSAGERLLAVTSLSFDIAGLELFLPLLEGGVVEVADRDTAANGLALAARLEASRADVLQATPASWKLLVEAGWQGGARVFCGGEELPRKLAEDLLARVSTVWNLYGPTETTIWSTVEAVTGSRLEPISIGRPIANTALYLLDRGLRPVAPGVAGSLYIGGEGLARGYLRQPAITAERFLPDPFTGPGGARMYATGDLARRLADGRLVFLGRGDHQIKLRGHRIEIGEIEWALGRHPGVQEAVVVLRSGGGGEPLLAAYLLPASGASPSAGELRAFLRERLPEVMVPSVFVPLASLPLTPNGKVDRRALPDPEWKAAATPSAGPRSGAERQVAEIWQEVLGRPPGRDDNFFDLGGHSLLLLRAHRRLEMSFGRAIPLTELFKYPTVASLARYLAGDAPAAEGGFEKTQARAARKHEQRPDPRALARRGLRVP